MKKMKKLCVIFIVLTLTFIATGCSLVDGVKNDFSGDKSSTVAKETDKYNAYVNLLNILTGNLTDYETAYAKNHMDEEGNFTKMDESQLISPYSNRFNLDNLQTVIEAADKAVSAKPKMDIDKEAEALVKVLKDEFDIFEEIHTYYEEKDYLTDDYAKGKELHDKLMTAYKAIDEPAQKFYDDMQTIMDKHEKEERKKYEKNNNKVSLAMIDFLEASEEASNLIYENVAEDGTITLTTEKYASVNKKISENLDKLKKFSENKKALEKDGYSSIDSFVNAASSFKTASNTVAGSFGDEENLMSAMNELVEKYSSLINSYNTTIVAPY